jgi:hypothetical protein
MINSPAQNSGEANNFSGKNEAEKSHRSMPQTFGQDPEQVFF